MRRFIGHKSGPVGQDDMYINIYHHVFPWPQSMALSRGTSRLSVGRLPVATWWWSRRSASASGQHFVSLRAMLLGPSMSCYMILPHSCMVRDLDRWQMACSPGSKVDYSKYWKRELCWRCWPWHMRELFHAFSTSRFQPHWLFSGWSHANFTDRFHNEVSLPWVSLEVGSCSKS